MANKRKVSPQDTSKLLQVPFADIVSRDFAQTGKMASLRRWTRTMSVYVRLASDARTLSQSTHSNSWSTCLGVSGYLLYLAISLLWSFKDI